MAAEVGVVALDPAQGISDAGGHGLPGALVPHR